MSFEYETLPVSHHITLSSETTKLETPRWEILRGKFDFTQKGYLTHESLSAEADPLVSRYIDELNHMLQPDWETFTEKSKDGGRVDLMDPPIVDGIYVSRSRNKTIEAISPLEQSFLLLKYPKSFHYQLAHSLLKVTEEDGWQSKVAARFIFRNLLPMFRLYEDEQMITKLQNKGFEVLDPDNYNRAKLAWEAELGFEYDEFDKDEFREYLNRNVGEALGITPNLFQIILRQKSLLTYYQKKLDDRSTTDSIAATLTIEPELLALLPNVRTVGLSESESMVSQLFFGVVRPIGQRWKLDPIENTFNESGRKEHYHDEYRVYNLDVFLPDRNCKMELKVTTDVHFSRNLKAHPDYKITTQRPKNIASGGIFHGVSKKNKSDEYTLSIPELNKALGDIAQSEGPEGFIFPDTSKVYTLLWNLINNKDYVSVATQRGTHILILKNDGGLETVLRTFSNAVSNTLGNAVKAFEIKRLETTPDGPVSKRYIFVLEPNPQLFTTEDMITFVSYEEPFAIENLDRIGALEKIRDEYSDFKTVGWLLDRIGKTPKEKWEEQDDWMVFERFPKLTYAMIDLIREEIDSINSLPVMQRPEKIKKFIRELYRNEALTRG